MVFQKLIERYFYIQAGNNTGSLNTVLCARVLNVITAYRYDSSLTIQTYARVGT